MNEGEKRNKAIGLFLRAVMNRKEIYGQDIGLSIYRTSKLPEMEAMAVHIEDYEAAALIRDERERRKSMRIARRTRLLN